MKNSKVIHKKSVKPNQWRKNHITRNTVATSRLQKSVEASQNLVELGRKKLAIKEEYYKKKILTLERQTKIMDRQAESLEKIQNNFKEVAKYHIV